MSFSIPPRASSGSAMSTASSPTSLGAGEASADVAGATRQFEAMILQSAFAPVASALGFYGDLVIGPVMQSILHAERR